MTLRTGVDIVVVARVAALLGESESGLVERIWTEHELLRCAGRAESLAARWAAKEACLKVLRLGLDEVSLTDIEVDSDQGHPELVLRGDAARRAAAEGLSQFSVSLSHDGGIAIAVVVAGSDGGRTPLGGPGGLGNH